MFDYRAINTDMAKNITDAILLERIRHIETGGHLPHGWGLLAELCKRFENRMIDEGITPFGFSDSEQKE